MPKNIEIQRTKGGGLLLRVRMKHEADDMHSMKFSSSDLKYLDGRMHEIHDQIHRGESREEDTSRT